jgi:two-component SAPR family response regulator
MEHKIPDGLLDLYESMLSAQLRAVRQLKTSKSSTPKRETSEGMSNIKMVLDILRQARKPLHVSEILTQVKAKYKITLDRESLVSALVKKVHRNQGLTRTAPNTFEATNR